MLIAPGGFSFTRMNGMNSAPSGYGIRWPELDENITGDELIDASTCRISSSNALRFSKESNKHMIHL